MPTQRFCTRIPILTRLLLLSTAGFWLSSGLSANGDESLDPAIAAIRNVSKEGAGIFKQAMPAAELLRKTPVVRLASLLDGLEDANPIAENWLRGVVFDVVRGADDVPMAMLKNYAMDKSRNATGRGLAMELIQRESPEAASELIDQCLNDPSLPLREMAVEQAIQRAKGNEKKDAASAKAQYREALVAARHPRQLSRILEALGKLGEDVKAADAFVMITKWKGLAPFDNVDGVGFGTAYLPEQQFTSGSIDFDATYDGKHGAIAWQEVDGSEDDGAVDLAAAYDKEKGAVGYLYTEFESPEAMSAQARLGCINANKVFINGKLVMANEVYHSGSMIDQYTAEFPLEKGTNRILLKICQNEQTEDWAQDWTFQFRITDPTGKALRSAE